MLYIINRASTHSFLEPPYEGAFIKKFTSMIEIRTCSADEYNKIFFKEHNCSWLDYGEQHSITDKGYIYRIIPTDCDEWVIKIRDFNDMLAIILNSGHAISIRESYYQHIFEIIIEDDF